jgi:hypothetical protein
MPSVAGTYLVKVVIAAWRGTAANWPASDDRLLGHQIESSVERGSVYMFLGMVHQKHSLNFNEIGLHLYGPHCADGLHANASKLSCETSSSLCPHTDTEVTEIVHYLF